MSRPYLILIVCNIFWGGNTVAGKMAVGHIDAYSLTILRWTGALILVLPFAIRPLRRDWPVIRQRWWLYLFYGAVGFTSFNMLMYIAAYYTSGVNSSLEQVAVNIFVIVLNFALFRLKVKPLQLVGVAITIAGVALIATHGDLLRILKLDVNLGDLLVIAACFIYATYSIALRWRPQTNWLSFMVATFIGAILAAFAYQAGTGPGPVAFFTGLATIDTEGWLIVAYVRALQLSQHASVDDVLADRRSSLDAPGTSQAIQGTSTAKPSGSAEAPAGQPGSTSKPAEKH